MRILEAKELFAGIVKELSSQIANHVLLATGSMVANKFAGIVLGNLTTYVIEKVTPLNSKKDSVSINLAIIPDSLSE